MKKLIRFFKLPILEEQEEARKQMKILFISELDDYQFCNLLNQLLKYENL